MRRRNQGGCEQARSLIEQAEALGEPLEDPLLFFSVLYAFLEANIGIQWRCLPRSRGAVPGARGEQRATVPLMVGHRLMGIPLVRRGTSRKAGALRSGIRVYDPAEHRPLARGLAKTLR